MKKWLPPIVAILLGSLTWETVRRVGHLPPVVLPPLQAVFLALFNIHDLWRHIGRTAAETVTGFMLGNIASIILAMAIIRWSRVEAAIMPYAIALKTTPVPAFVPILIIWLGAGFWSNAVAAASICFFALLINGVRGLRAVEQDYL